MPSLTARIGAEDVTVRIDGDLSPAPDAALPAFLLPAMWRGEPLTIDGALSRSLHDRIPEIEGILRSWFDADRVPVQASSVDDGNRLDGSACFFSGGVDSFHTALKHRDAITALVFVRGFDIPLDDHVLWERSLAAVSAAARALGKPLIVVETDVRDVLRPNWEAYHGSAIAAVGHMLGVGTVLIPASYTLRDLFPWGSHPLLDPLWSTGRTRFLHDGADASRFEKTSAIAAHPVVLEHLRVCWRNPGSAYNCGECSKCVRTMIALHLNGTLDRCSTLPPLDLRRVRALRPTSPTDVVFTRDNLDAARERDPRLAREIERSFRLVAMERPLRAVARRLPGAIAARRALRR